MIIHDDGVKTMMKLIAEMPNHLEASCSLEGLSVLRPISSKQKSVVVCGMGGSAIAGDLLKPLFDDAGVQIFVNREYSLPAWVDHESFLVFSSYSGNTEETLSCFKEALAGNFNMLVISSGGKLSELASENNLPVIVLPSGMPPRASLGFSMGALLNTASKLEIISDCTEQLNEAVYVMKEGIDFHSDKESEIAKLASESLNKHIVVHTTSPDIHSVGIRVVGQINENSKYPASNGCYPELNHNEIVGWDETSGKYCLLVLRSSSEHTQVSRRVDITNDLLKDQFEFIREFHAKGNSKLAQIFSLIQVGDYFSCHLSRVAGKNPIPVTRIDILKDRLSKG
jgi:glucose/mannose-6-phosphate isomerase